MLDREEVDYIENQCNKQLPDCSYTLSKQDVAVTAMDDILYSRTVQDCERFCDDVRKTTTKIAKRISTCFV